MEQLFEVRYFLPVLNQMIIFMSEQIVNNKRVAKNTILLFFRMLLTMGISLYTSRAIIQILGVQDYGIYNVVGGVIAMFGFVNGSLTVATQRYITFELGKGEKGKESKVFSTCLILHIILAVIIVIIADAISVWFLYHKLLIPADRLMAAFWILQFALLSTFVMIVSVPYNALIVAHEKMDAFAFISIVEAVLKLIIVYSLLVIPFDKLIVYGFLILVTQIVIRFCYSIYCHAKIKTVKFKYVWDFPLVKEIAVFAGSSVFGNITFLACTQGVNVLLGAFFLPAVNAARGIAVQAQGAINSFVQGFQTAINPQITKTYAAGLLEEMHTLIFRSSRFSFYLLLIISLPILLEAEPILKLWLGIVPEYTVIFLRLIILTTWINTCANPLNVASKASGKVWKYETSVSACLLMILPISYILLKIGLDAWIVFAVHLVLECIAQIVRVRTASKLIGFEIRCYWTRALSKILLVACCSIIIPLFVYLKLSPGVVNIILVSLISVISSIITVYFVGLEKTEKNYINSQIVSRIKI